MPKTSINKHCKTGYGKDEIWSAEDLCSATPSANFVISKDAN
jgi:hypothetical protein